jgi:hypothetical protein
MFVPLGFGFMWGRRPACHGVLPSRSSLRSFRFPWGGFRSRLFSLQEIIVLNASARSLRTLALTLVVAGSCWSVSAFAQDKKEAETQLRDFVHYTLINRYDLAAANAQALLDRLPAPYGKAEDGKGMSLSTFARLVEGTGELSRFERTAGSGQRVPELEAVASKLLRAYEAGKLEMARDANEISKSIALLTGSQTQRMYARERLMAAGEYATPQLVSALQNRANVALTGEVRTLLVDMRGQAVGPLCAALSGTDAATQEVIAGILGEIPHKRSLPYLYELASNTSTDAVKQAAIKAITRIDGAYNPSASVAAMFRSLGEGFYNKQTSLISFPNDDHQIIWNYLPSVGLNPVPVRSEVAGQAMAMRLSEKALAIDPSDQGALALWVASNFKRELDSPKDYKNPLYAADRPGAMHYAVAAGAGVNQRVLARALDNKDTALARKAIGALDKTAGANALAASNGSRRPLLDALRYPNRRVQYEAALALANAQPSTTFDGADRVVPILASAVRDSASKYAVVIAKDAERQNSLGKQLKALGYTLLSPGASLSASMDSISSAPGVDLLVTDLTGSASESTIAEARATPRLGATPIISLADGVDGVANLNGKFSTDPMFRVVRTGTDEASFAAAVTQLVDKATGEAMTAADAQGYQSKALAALRDLAVSNSPVFSLADAAGSLTGALGEVKGPARAQVAEVLARINDKRVQTALADAALSSEGEEMNTMLAKLADSGKRYGNMLDDRQVKRLVELAGSATGESATALAAALGSLNIKNDALVPLILGQKK